MLSSGSAGDIPTVPVEKTTRSSIRSDRQFRKRQFEIYVQSRRACGYIERDTLYAWIRQSRNLSTSEQSKGIARTDDGAQKAYTAEKQRDLRQHQEPVSYTFLIR